jgi:hypothetical protein
MHSVIHVKVLIIAKHIINQTLSIIILIFILNDKSVYIICIICVHVLFGSGSIFHFCSVYLSAGSLYSQYKSMIACLKLKVQKIFAIEDEFPSINGYGGNVGECRGMQRIKGKTR